MVQWLGLCTSNAMSPGLIAGWGTKILLASQDSQKNPQKLTKKIDLNR